MPLIFNSIILVWLRLKKMLLRDTELILNFSIDNTFIDEFFLMKSKIHLID